MTKWGPIMPEWRPMAEAPDGQNLLLGCWIETAEGTHWSWWLSCRPSDGDPDTGTLPTHFLADEDLPRPPRRPDGNAR